MTRPYLVDEALALAARQKRKELAALIGVLSTRRLGAVLEIGTLAGGTLHVWCQLASEDATIVSVDLPGGPFGGGYDVSEIPRLQALAKPGQRLHLVRRDSHDPSTRALVEDLLAGRMLDFLFIDGDHTYDGVRSDFELYAELVQPGSLIAFHDILPHPPEKGVDVERFWRELAAARPHLELVERRPDKPWGGIGVIEA